METFAENVGLQALLPPRTCSSRNLSFAAAKIDFDDIRLDGEEWAKEKACEYKTLKLAKFFIGKIAAYKHSFCYSNVPATKTKELFVSTANGSLVGTFCWHISFLVFLYSLNFKPLLFSSGSRYELKNMSKISESLRGK